MTSYILMQLCGNWVPIKVGGYQGKEEMRTPAGMAEKLAKAERKADKEKLKELTKQIEDVSISDIKGAYIGWVPKSNANCVNTKTKSVTVRTPDGDMEVPVWKVTAWSRGSKAIWFDYIHDDVYPFEEMKKSDIKAMLYQGIEALMPGSVVIDDVEYEWTLARTPRKSHTSRAPSYRGLSGEIKLPAPERRRGRQKEPPERRVLKDGTIQVWVEDTEMECYTRGETEVCGAEGGKIERKGHWRTVGKQPMPK